MKLVKSLMNIIVLLIIAYFVIGLLLFLFQRSIIYYPVERISHTFEELSYKNDNQDIKVILINKGFKKALLYFGGNAEPVAYNAAEFSQTFQNHTVYLVNYRGYGGSSGSPTEAGLFSDAKYIFNQIKLRHTDVTIIGRSLGTAVASYLAAESNISKLVLITPFDSIEHIAQDSFPIYPMNLLLKDKFNSLGLAKDIKAKTLIMVAENDLVMVHSLSKRRPTDRGNAVIDIFRVMNEKIVEHWDVSQSIPEKSANTNTMF